MEKGGGGGGGGGVGWFWSGIMETISLWGGDTHLCLSFPSLFFIACSKEAWMNDVWSLLKGGLDE